MPWGDALLGNNNAPYDGWTCVADQDVIALKQVLNYITYSSQVPLIQLT
jgi:hypothetical protein